MSRRQLTLDEDILALAETLALRKGVSVEKLVADLVEQAGESSRRINDNVMGLFSDDPGLIDQITEDALSLRD